MIITKKDLEIYKTDEKSSDGMAEFINSFFADEFRDEFKSVGEDSVDVELFKNELIDMITENQNRAPELLAPLLVIRRMELDIEASKKTETITDAFSQEYKK